jgi:transketolase
VVFAYGPVMLSEAHRAAGLLRERRGLGVRVVNLPWLNLVDGDWLSAEVSGVPAVFTLDDHYVSGAQGEYLAARLAELGRVPPGGIRRFGVRTIPACGQNDEVLRAHRLDADSLATDFAAAMAGGPPD